MSVKKYTPDLLIEFTGTIVEIECSSCGEGQSVWGMDDTDAVKEFFADGWRATDLNCYCPKCAPKKLKGVTPVKKCKINR
jgi:hypothetical protein